VRGLAVKAIERRITKKYAPKLLSNIYLIASLAISSRYDHSSYVEAVHSLIRNVDLKNNVKEVLVSDDIYMRRECYKIVLKSDGFYLHEIIELGANDSDVIVRNCVIKSLNRVSDITFLKRHLQKLENDPFMPNRRDILNLYMGLGPEHSHEKLLNALFDPHPSIRYYARYYLSKTADIDYAFIYREAIKNPLGKNLIGIISGLGETGNSSDAELIVKFLKHQIAKIRKNSIKAIARLSAENHQESFLSLVIDDSPRVSREAVSALLQCKYQGIVQGLWDTLENYDKNHIAKNVLFMASKLSKWESITYIVEVLSSPNKNIRGIADGYLNRWLRNFNRSFTKPTNAQIERIASLIRAHRNEIGDNRIRTIEFNMKGF
jgi:hypothetical protein